MSGSFGPVFCPMDQHKKNILFIFARRVAWEVRWGPTVYCDTLAADLFWILIKLFRGKLSFCVFSFTRWHPFSCDDLSCGQEDREVSACNQAPLTILMFAIWYNCDKPLIKSIKLVYRTLEQSHLAVWLCSGTPVLHAFCQNSTPHFHGPVWNTKDRKYSTKETFDRNERTINGAEITLI